MFTRRNIENFNRYRDANGPNFDPVEFRSRVHSSVL